MKALSTVLAILMLAVVAVPQTKDASQTKDLGLGAFSSENGPILLAVDSSLVPWRLKQPYAMFILYMAAKDSGKNIVVARDGIVLVYKGQEYKMPSLQDLRKNYSAEIHDLDFYHHLGKEGIIASWMRLYKFPEQGDFFPPLSFNASVPTNEGSMSGSLGFVAKCYFKNPGFEKGDTFVIRVTAKNDPSLVSEVEVTLK